jgi:hypothetical protein
MIYNNAFIHRDGVSGSDSATMINPIDNIFRSNVIQFINDKQTHPIVKYKGFIVAFILVIAGLFILLLFNHERILGHPLLKNLFVPVTELKWTKKYSDSIDFDYDYRVRDTEAAIFREAIEGLNLNKNNNGITKIVTEPFDSSKTPCGTDCTNYVELKGKINNLSKYVDEVKEQTEQVKETSKKIQELGKQIEDLNKSLSPQGQLNIKVE